MFSTFGALGRRQARRYFTAGGAWTATMLTILHAWATDPAATQSAAPQAYRIGVGDKVGVVVIGQPDLSGEVTVDQGGNVRLPYVGDIRAANLTPSELERSIGRSLEQGYVRHPVVSVSIAEFRPIHVLGMVRTPGSYPYRQGQSVLAAIARAGGIGTPERSGTGGDLFQTDERVRLLEINRVALLAKRARLIAQQNGDDKIDFPDMSGLPVDPARITQIRDGERRTFMQERQAEQQATEALRKQLPRLDAEIALLKRQGELEQRQHDLNQQLVADYEKLAKSGLARKPTYIEIKREEARIEGNIARLKSETLKAELAIGDLQFKLTELHNSYQRRVLAELRETERSLLELTITLPSARRARAARAPQLRSPTGTQKQELTITVIRADGTTTVKYDAAARFLLRPGDIVEVESLLPPWLELLPDQPSASGERSAESHVPLPTGATAGPERTLQ